MRNSLRDVSSFRLFTDWFLFECLKFSTVLEHIINVSALPQVEKVNPTGFQLEIAKILALCLSLIFSV